jgi:hypothetical protein
MTNVAGIASDDDFRRLPGDMDAAGQSPVAAPETVSFGNFLTHKSNHS